MTPFLRHVAEDILAKYGTNLSDIAVVFPNKRASLFLNEELARLAGKPMWSPAYITISDLFRHHSDLKVGDPIKLVCDMHRSFVKCTGISETLDHFYGWGQLLIADFDDVDKNMADADKLFANLRDIHELDDISYLSEEQKSVIKTFFSNFSDDHNTELKQRFLQLWSHLLDIYHDFNNRLSSQGLAYEGMLYRKVVEDENICFAYRKYLFVGFNMMQKVETLLCQRLMLEDKAAFYWDYDDYYMTPDHEAGHYIRQYQQAFPNELSTSRFPHAYDNMKRQKDVTFAAASTEHIQASYVHTWLKENERYKAGRRTAIVLADESLLPSVIHALPEETDCVNVTLGYPLALTPFYTLVQQLVALHTLGVRNGGKTFRLKMVNKVLRHPYAPYISPDCAALADQLIADKVFFPTCQQLTDHADEGIQLLFSQMPTDKASFNKALAAYLLNVLRLVGTNAVGEGDALFQESLFRTYTLVNRLAELMDSGDLTVDTITFERLLQQLFTTTSIPFHGEPAEGIQIMGILETRNLDFDHMLVLSCNEGNLPKGVNDASFIPYSLRKAYGLTTVDHKVAIYAYYFHRMLQRASDVTLAYNNATRDGHTGEMSRFMLQLAVESSYTIRRIHMETGQTPLQKAAEEKEKTDQMVDALMDNRTISPTALCTYLRCPLRFYYRYVLGLEEPEEISDEIDNRHFGLIFHRAAQLFYLRFASPSDIVLDKDGKEQLCRPIVVSHDALKQQINNSKLLENLVDQAFAEEMHHNSARVSDYNGLQRINRQVVIRYLRKMLEVDQRFAPLTIIGLEKKVSAEYTLNTPSGKRTIMIGGIIDRLDAVPANAHGSSTSTMQRIRVIDYKTGRDGKVHPKDVNGVFDPALLEHHSDYYLQTMLYSLIVAQDERLNPAHYPVSPGLMFIQQTGAADYDPTIGFGKNPILDASVYAAEFRDGLQALISEICDTTVPFSPTEVTTRCKSCPFATLCKG